MRYINNNTIKPTPGAATRYLEDLGITSPESFLYKPKPSDYESPWDLTNMKEMIEALHNAFEADKRFFLQVDSDTDGITSSAIFYNYFKTLYPNAHIEYRVHEGKEHGVILDTVPIDAQVIIIPDAGSNQLDEQEALEWQGRTVLIMDHHIVNHVEHLPHVIIVNNQSSDKFKNKQLSGAGVVYKVIEAYDSIYGNGMLYRTYQDLAALGIIADCMDCRTLDNNAIVMNGLKSINNEMFHELLEKQSGGGLRIKDTDNPTKIDIAFYIAPLINAVIRAGSLAEKRQLFEGFIGVGVGTSFERDYRGKHYVENLFEYIARTAVNLRAKQNRIKEQSVETLITMVENQKLDENKVLIMKVGSETVNKNLTGLVAMDMVNHYGKPTLVLRPVVETETGGKKVTYYRGSGRASIVPGFTNFMEVLRSSGLMDYVEGHENAFGASVKEENIPALTEYLNETLKDVDFTAVQFVDCCMDDKNWNNIVLKEFGLMERIYGNGIPEPRFHFEFDAKATDFRVQGAQRNSLKISHQGTTMIAFRCADLVAQYEEYAQNDPFGRIHVELIGTSTINTWNGYDNVQIMIKEVELSAAADDSLF